MQVWGHEGHGVPGQGETLTHYILDPYHLPLALLACAALVLGCMAIRSPGVKAYFRFPPKQ